MQLSGIKKLTLRELEEAKEGPVFLSGQARDWFRGQDCYGLISKEGQQNVIHCCIQPLGAVTPALNTYSLSYILEHFDVYQCVLPKKGGR